ncbi:MAG: TIGR00299 family protein [SAR202 cluster bacterium Io17-Chloro-G2]|nr:MAG: TIGR00299 family protein [SAR202 cluster bacterium Io17-Chloro-G2]
MKIAYVQSIGGASGDMLLAALLDAGLPLDFLQDELAKLPVAGYALSAIQEARREMRGLKLNVEVKEPARYSPKRLLEIVSSSALDHRTKQRAEMVLTALWTAEGRVHGESQEELELEELGTVDTLVDVVGVSIGLDYLGVEKVYASPLVLGAAEPPRRPGGYPNPAPATLELAAMAGAPVAADHPMYQGAGELTTPTGAALITALAEFDRPALSVKSVGVGLGSKDPDKFPNILKVWLGEMTPAPVTVRQGDIVLLETNLDDVQGEVMGYAQEQLFSLGAFDVWCTPVQMKKNRPGVVLSALVPQRLEDAAVQLILRETPTLGVRTRPVERYVAQRESLDVETDLGVISVKVKSLEGEPVGVAPEYEDCRRVSLETGVPYQEVYQRALAEARRRFLG